jgi:hypothetical protein
MLFRTRRISLALVLTTPLLCSACSEPTPPVSEPTAWTVDSRPLLEIRDDDLRGEVLLGVAEYVTRLPDGGVLIADRGLHSLRFFSPDGRFQRAVGRQGSGPGEFEYIRRANRCGDSLFVEDVVGQRVGVYTLDGTLARTATTREFGGGAPAFTSACNANGVFVHLAFGGQFDPSKRGRHREPVAVWLSSTARGRIAELGSVPGHEYVGMGDGTVRGLLRRTQQIAIGREYVYVGSADSGVVNVYTLDGAPAGVRRLPDTDLRATAADIERAKRLDSMGQSAEEQAYTRAGWALDQPPATLPAYDAMLVDSEGYLWVRRYPLAGDTHTPWIVFDQQGEHVVTVALPAMLTVHEIGSDYVAAIELDPETGTHAVKVLTLKRAPGSPTVATPLGNASPKQSTSYMP